MRKLTTFVLLVIIILIMACNKQDQTKKEKDPMQAKIDQYALTEIKYDPNLLDEKEKVVVKKIYEAAKIIDELFFEQVYSKNGEIRTRLQNSTDPKDKLLLQYFTINVGPFDRLDANLPFIGAEKKPLGANFYPEDMTKEEFENWIKAHPGDEKAFTSEYTVIRREGANLKAIPYTEYYKDKTSKIAALLREASEYAENPTLKKYLVSRAKSFESNDYYQSDMDWMDLKNHKIETVIGPFEVYEDEMFNYKAAYECFLTIVDPAESQKLDKFASYLTEIEKNLPLEEKHKNFKRGSESPMVVVQLVYSAGDTKAGVQTLAFNLPNDERVRAAKGSKKVMLKNIHEAKFDKLLKPIADQVLDKNQLKYITFDAFFNHTLMHEISHGVGPGFIKVNGKDSEVKKELKETYSKIEECKADLLGMYNNMFMIEKGLYPKEFENSMWATFLAGIFRSVRFGIDAAHGAGNAMIFNYILEKGGYIYDAKTQTVKVDLAKIYAVVKDMSAKVLLIQATGDYAGAKEMLAKYGVVSEPMKVLTGKLTELPRDIWPDFQIDKEMNK